MQFRVILTTLIFRGSYPSAGDTVNVLFAQSTGWHIYSHLQTVSLDYNSSVWLLPSIRVTLRQLDNLPKSYHHTQRKRRIFSRIYFYIYAIGYRSAQFMKRALYLRVCGSRQFPTEINYTTTIFIKTKFSSKPSHHYNFSSGTISDQDEYYKVFGITCDQTLHQWCYVIKNIYIYIADQK